MSDSDKTINNQEQLIPALIQQSAENELQLTEDGGVTKRILVHGIQGTEFGEPDDTPTKGTEVSVHYVGRLLSNGEVFDSSRERNEPFKFFLGKGSVIKGWEESVKTMKRGEKALVTIKPEYGYGSAGSPPKIPPNATLQFEIELIDWSSDEDITQNKDKGVLKRILTEGEGWKKPKEDEQVTINYTLKRMLNGKPTDQIIQEKKDFSFFLGSDEVPFSGLELAIKEMKKGEKSTLKVNSTYAFGTSGNESLQIKPNEDIFCEVELSNWNKEKETWEMTTAEKLEELVKRKEEGNVLFKQGKYERAQRKYKKAIDCVQSDYSFSEEEKTRAKQMKLPCHLNSSLCLLKMHKWKDAKEQANKVLEIDSKNTKALFRRAKALIGLDEWEAAMRDLNSCKEIDPNREVLQEITNLKRKIAQQNKKEAKLFQNLFERLREEEEKEKEQKPIRETNEAKGEERMEVDDWVAQGPQDMVHKSKDEFSNMEPMQVQAETCA